jgi:MOSC domain-containing protein YiiM
LRIIDEAMIEAGTKIEVIYRPEHGITIKDIFAAKSGSREKISEIAQVSELSDEYQQWAKKLYESIRN